MAISKTSVSKQAPRTRPVIDDRGRSINVYPVNLEDSRLEEVEEPVPGPAAQKPPRLTVNGVAVRRLQLDLGKDTNAFHPAGAVIDRFWDQYDDGEDKDKYSRPRVFSNAIIEVLTRNGYLDLTASWPDKPGVTKLIQPGASMMYEA